MRGAQVDIETLTHYRNDLDAAHARIDALEDDKRRLAEENARLQEQIERARLVDEPPRTTPARPSPPKTEEAFDAIKFAFVLIGFVLLIAMRASCA